MSPELILVAFIVTMVAAVALLAVCFRYGLEFLSIIPTVVLATGLSVVVSVSLGWADTGDFWWWAP